MGDACAHRAAADDDGVLDLFRLRGDLLGERALRAMAQEKEAHQVFGGITVHQLDEGIDFGFEAGLEALIETGADRVDQLQRRGVMVVGFLARLRFGGGEDAIAQEAGGGGEALFPIGGVSGGMAHEKALAGGGKRFGADDFVNHADAHGLFGGQRLAGEKKREGFGEADRTRQAGGPAPGGDDAELYFGEANVDRALFNGDAIGAGERELVAAAEAVSIDGGGGGHGEGGDAAEYFLAVGEELGDLLAIHLANLEEIGAGDEVAFLGGGENDTGGSILRELRQRGVQIRQHLRRNGIDRLAWQIEPDGGDVVDVAGDSQRAFHSRYSKLPTTDEH